MSGLSGCSGSYPWDNSKKEVPAVTWQDEKAKTQTAMHDIVAQIPKDVVVQAEVKGTGTLFGCNKTGPNGEKLHSWTGSATVTVKPGIDIESIVKTVEEHYKNLGYKVSSRFDVLGEYEAQVKPPNEESSYYVTKGEPDQISVASWSECFQLPDGLYPGGDF